MFRPGAEEAAMRHVREARERAQAPAPRSEAVTAAHTPGEAPAQLIQINVELISLLSPCTNGMSAMRSML